MLKLKPDINFNDPGGVQKKILHKVARNLFQDFKDSSSPLEFVPESKIACVISDTNAMQPLIKMEEFQQGFFVYSVQTDILTQNFE